MTRAYVQFPPEVWERLVDEYVAPTFTDTDDGWPEEYAEADLRYLEDRVASRKARKMPAERALAERWGWGRKRVARFLRVPPGDDDVKDAPWPRWWQRPIRPLSREILFGRRGGRRVRTKPEPDPEPDEDQPDTKHDEGTPDIDESGDQSGTNEEPHEDQSGAAPLYRGSEDQRSRDRSPPTPPASGGADPSVDESATREADLRRRVRAVVDRSELAHRSPMGAEVRWLCPHHPAPDDHETFDNVLLERLLDEGVGFEAAYAKAARDPGEGHLRREVWAWQEQHPPGSEPCAACGTDVTPEVTGGRAMDGPTPIERIRAREGVITRRIVEIVRDEVAYTVRTKAVAAILEREYPP